MSMKRLNVRHLLIALVFLLSKNGVTEGAKVTSGNNIYDASVIVNLFEHDRLSELVKLHHEIDVCTGDFSCDYPETIETFSFVIAATLSSDMAAGMKGFEYYIDLVNKTSTQKRNVSYAAIEVLMASQYVVNCKGKEVLFERVNDVFSSYNRVDTILSTKLDLISQVYALRCNREAPSNKEYSMKDVDTLLKTFKDELAYFVCAGLPTELTGNEQLRRLSCADIVAKNRYDPSGVRARFLIHLSEEKLGGKEGR